MTQVNGSTETDSSCLVSLRDGYELANTTLFNSVQEHCETQMSSTPSTTRRARQCVTHSTTHCAQEHSSTKEHCGAKCGKNTHSVHQQQQQQQLEQMSSLTVKPTPGWLVWEEKSCCSSNVFDFCLWSPSYIFLKIWLVLDLPQNLIGLIHFPRNLIGLWSSSTQKYDLNFDVDSAD